MAITPKNWDAFQHYKDRAPAWIKLHRGLLDDFEYNCLPLASRALAPMLWLLASEYEGGKITASVEALAFRLRISTDDLVSALKPLIESGFFIDDSNTLASRYHGASLEEEGEEYRKEEETDIRAVASATRTNYEIEFQDFWKLYPKRKGANPRKPAFKAFCVCRKNGATLEVLKRGLSRDIERWRQAKQLGTEFIPLATTWLNQARWDDHADAEQSAEITAKSVIPGTPEFEKLLAAAKPGSFQHSQMTRSLDTRQPYYPPPELLASIETLQGS